MIDAEDVFWDSCVFIRYLTQTPTEYLSDIEDYIRDAQSGKRRIYFSTIALTEIRPRFLKKRGYGAIGEFFEDFSAAFTPVDTTPNILIRAGQLRDAVATDPSNGKPSKRVIGTADAIHLMTCLHARDTLGIPNIVFQTFDNGKGATWEGKCVPLLSFEKWFPDPARTPYVADVCNLSRRIPIYPQLRMNYDGVTHAPSPRPDAPIT